MRARVTGIGIVSPLGIGRESFWEALCAGRTAIGEIRRFDAGGEIPPRGAEVADFPAREFLPPTLVRRMDRVSQMIGVAAVLAAADAGLTAAGTNGEDLAVVVGAALGNITESVQFLDRVFTRGPSLANPMLFPNLVMNAPASQVSMALGWRGPNLTVSAGEISGEAAIEVALGLLRRGRARAVVVAAGEELAEMTFRALERLRALSPRRGGGRSMPFDVDADGPILGEGAAAVVIENGDSAERRGAHVRASIEAVERFALAVRAPTLWPAPQAAVDLCARATSAADIGLCGADSSPERDALELALMSRLLPAGRPLYALSGAVGTHGGLGLTTVATAVLALSSGRLPPIVGLERPRCDVPFVLPRVETRGSWSRACVLGTARGGAGMAIELAGPGESS
jgi:3-oxoacyl-(acyl-carrier-protein) synthase